MNGKQELQIYREQLLSRMQNVVEDLQTTVDHLSAEQLLSPCLAGGETPHHVLAHLAVIEEYALWPRLQRTALSRDK